MPHSSALQYFGSVELAINTLKDSWAWYVIRASGLVSFALIILLMASGIGHVTGWTYRFLAPVKAWAIHKAMAIILAISLAVHILTLLFDNYVTFKLPQLFIPFLKNYNNNTNVLGLTLGWFAIPAGILAAYGVYIVVLSSLDTVGWISRHKKLWKTVHIVSYASMFLVIIHVLNVGTDFKESLWRLAMLGLLLVFVIGIFFRLLRTKILVHHDKS